MAASHASSTKRKLLTLYSLFFGFIFFCFGALCQSHARCSNELAAVGESLAGKAFNKKRRGWQVNSENKRPFHFGRVFCQKGMLQVWMYADNFVVQN